MKNLLIIISLCLVLPACQNSGDSAGTEGQDPPQSMVKKEPASDGKGVGEIKQVTLENPLDQEMVKKGKAIYEMKCSACHKLTDQRVVGPGWAGLTKIRKPEWIMNMINNVDSMRAEDPIASQLLEECLVRMPNQNISIGDSRDILEFMRQNDGEE